MKPLLIRSVLVLVLLALSRPVPGENLMAGKLITGRAVKITATVAAPVDKIYELWTTREGVVKFFGTDARIGTAPGDPYEIIFRPEVDPDGSSYGTKGARLLSIEKNRKLAFEWIPFVGDPNAGEQGPPYAPPEERNARPLPTWVEVELRPAAEDPSKSEVSLAHYGFRSGGKWDPAFAYFQEAWRHVLTNLQEYFARAADL